MKCVISLGTILALAVLVGGCTTSTPASRIERHQAAYASWPAAVQARVKTGQVEVGFTPEMVRVALGEPDVVRTLTTPQGQSEVWIYFDHSPHLSIGVGVDVSAGRNAFGGATGVAASPEPEEQRRVIFERGRVAAIETTI